MDRRPLFKPLAIALTVGIFCQASCIKNELNNLSDNVNVQQSFSIPLGAKELKLDAPPVSDTSSIRGENGRFYYNNLPYTCDFHVFPALYSDVNFNLSSSKKIDLIKSIEFLVLCENKFPLEAGLDVYLLDSNGNTLEHFKNTTIFIDAGHTNSSGEIVPSHNVINVKYTDMNMLKQCTQLRYKLLIFTDLTSNINNTYWLTDNDNFKVTISARAQLDYKINEL